MGAHLGRLLGPQAEVRMILAIFRCICLLFLTSLHSSFAEVSERNLSLHTTPFSNTLGSSTMTCYYPDGSEAIKTNLGPTMLACDPSAKQSSCCAYGDNCMANGLCLSSLLFFYRGACTDRTWKDSACLQECKNSTQMPSGSPSLSNFQIISWCQNPYIKSPGVPNGSGLFVCSGATSDCGQKNFTLAAYSVAVTSVTGVTSTSSSSSSSSTSSSTSTLPPSSTSSNPTTTTSAAAAAAASTTKTGVSPTALGVGIAVPLSVLLLATFIFFFLERKKRIRAEKSLHQTNIQAYTQAESKSPSEFTTEVPDRYKAARQRGPIEVGHGGYDGVAEMPTGTETRRELWDESGYQGAGVGMDGDGGRSAVDTKYIGTPSTAGGMDGRDRQGDRFMNPRSAGAMRSEGYR